MTNYLTGTTMSEQFQQKLTNAHLQRKQVKQETFVKEPRQLLVSESVLAQR